MLFSLILSTKVRVQEIERFFESLATQTLQDFEIILSDQNNDGRLTELVKKWPFNGRLIYLNSIGGLSRGRNVGLDRATGEIVGFPDDDCCYPPTFLEDVAKFFRTHPGYGFLTGRSYADDGKDAGARHGKRAGPIERLKIYSQGIEFVFFIRRAELGSLRFDEKMGVGAPSPWHAAEGPDLMLQLINQGIHGYYDPRYAAWHPRPLPVYDAAAIDRAYRYACGSGYFLSKHQYPLWFFLFLETKTLAGFLLAYLRLNSSKALFYVARHRGYWRGWNGYERSDQPPPAPAPSVQIR
jgi:glycosyltransferase involved in cell wall biosynthesis